MSPDVSSIQRAQVQTLIERFEAGTLTANQAIVEAKKLELPERIVKQIAQKIGVVGYAEPGSRRVRAPASTGRQTSSLRCRF